MTGGQPRARTRTGFASVSARGTTASPCVNDGDSRNAPRGLISEISLPHADLPLSWHPLAENLQSQKGDAKVDVTDAINSGAEGMHCYQKMKCTY